ncbi:hypothetical protein, partial [Pseudomonas syringae group genomosp. 7]|uniref:hypothetical protein n=1 Tax=Pseudomonas syringae group genomosp. 7 TaxID=251699 RepID=UPI003770042C
MVGLGVCCFWFCVGGWGWLWGVVWGGGVCGVFWWGGCVVFLCVVVGWVVFWWWGGWGGGGLVLWVVVGGLGVLVVAWFVVVLLLFGVVLGVIWSGVGGVGVVGVVGVGFGGGFVVVVVWGWCGVVGFGDLGVEFGGVGGGFFVVVWFFGGLCCCFWFGCFVWIGLGCCGVSGFVLCWCWWWVVFFCVCFFWLYGLGEVGCVCGLGFEWCGRSFLGAVRTRRIVRSDPWR